MLALNPRLSFRFRLGQNHDANDRFWLGFCSPNVDPNGDTAADGTSAFMLGARTTDTNFQLIHNDGGTPAIYLNTGISAANTSTHVFQVIGESSLGRWLYRLDTGGFIDVPLDNPASTTALQLWWGIQVAGGTTKILDLQDMECRIDSK